MSEDLPKIPEGWVWATLGEICGSTKGKKPKTLGPRNNSLSIPYITIKAFEKGVFEQFTDGIACELCQKDDILMVWDGARSGLVGRGVEGAVGSTLAKLDSHEMNNSLLFYFLQSQFNYINTRTKGVGIPHVDPNIFWNIPFPLPPLPEQHRIVTKIEELFTKLDAGVEALKKVKTQLKRYRQSVLKTAMEGKLTQKWREAHKDELEHASVLLKRIKEERKKKLGKKYKELPPVDTYELPELPEGWVWGKLNMICDKVQDGSHFSPKNQFNDAGEGRYLYITAKNIKEEGIALSNVTYVDSSFHSAIYERCTPEYGDVLLIKDGVKTGIATINTLKEEFSLLSSVALLKPNKDVLNSHYLKNFLNSPIGFRMITGKMTGTAIKRIILDKIRTSPIPLPPLREQNKIVDEIDRYLSVADKVGKEVENNLKKAERLRQSILKRAFEGKLVPQDPSDEPASVLLERIKAEKAKREAEARAQKKALSRKRKLNKKVQTRLM